VWREARQLEEGHRLHTVEDHCPQTHLSIDEGLDETRVMLSDAEKQRRGGGRLKWREDIHYTS
jgi:hypothetical protein